MRFFGNGKVTEENGENEYVIHTQGEFDNVAGKKLHRGVRSQRKGNKAAKGEGEGNPSGGGLQGAPQVNGAWITMEKNQIGGQQCQDEGSKQNPTEMGRGTHGNLLW